jgi:hypothetical protein
MDTAAMANEVIVFVNECWLLKPNFLAMWYPNCILLIYKIRDRNEEIRTFCLFDDNFRGVLIDE